MKTASCSAPVEGHIPGSDKQKQCPVHGTGKQANSVSLAIASQPPLSLTSREEGDVLLEDDEDLPQEPREGSDLPINTKLPPKAGYLNVGLRIESGHVGDDNYAYEDCVFGSEVEFSNFDGGHGPKFADCLFEGKHTLYLARESQIDRCTFEGSAVADGDVIMSDCTVAGELVASGGTQLFGVTAETIRLEGASEAMDCVAHNIFAFPEEADRDLEGGLLRPQISGGVYGTGVLDSTDVYGGGEAGHSTPPMFREVNLLDDCDVTSIKVGSITLGMDSRVKGIEPLGNDSPVIINALGFDPSGEPTEPLVVIDHDGFIVVGDSRIDGAAMSYPKDTTIWVNTEKEARDPKTSIIRRSLALRPEDGSEGQRIDARNSAAWGWLHETDSIGDDGVSEDDVQIALQMFKNPA